MEAPVAQQLSQQTSGSAPDSSILLPDTDNFNDPHVFPTPLRPNGTHSTSSMPLLSIRCSGQASCTSYNHATCIGGALGRNVTSASSDSPLFTCTSAPLSGWEARSSASRGDTQATRPTEGTQMPSAVAGVAAGGVSLPLRSSFALPLEVPNSEGVRELAAVEKAWDAEEVHSCMTLSSTETSPRTPPVQAAASPPPPQPRLLLSLPSNEGQCGPHSATPQKAERSAQLLSCDRSILSLSTVITSPAMTGTTAVHTPAPMSPAPSKPPGGPSTVTPTVTLAHHAGVLSDAGKHGVQQEAHERPYVLLDSEFSGSATSSDAAPLLRSTEKKVPYRSLHPREGCAPPSNGVASSKDETEEAAPAAPPAAITTATVGSALSEEQRYAFHMAVEEHRSVFITGGAGTGKSHLLRTILHALPAFSTFVTATTGIAALNLSGSTLHSFVGCGIPNQRSTRDSLLSLVLSKQRCVRNWRVCRVLIIDEVSMLKPSFFELVDYIARHVRNRPREPFGGIQLVLSGDFLQLPPVSRERRSRSPQFCFETETWWKANPTVCLLSTPFRQRNARFFAILNEMRFGELQPESVELLYSMDTTERVHFVRRTDAAASIKAEGDVGGPECMRVGLKREADVSAQSAVLGVAACKTEKSATGMQQTRLELVDGRGRAMNAPFDGYTILRPTRAEVDGENEMYYAQLSTEVFVYRGFHTGRGDFPEGTLTRVVQLRKGCRVMLIKNFDPRLGLVNGSTGTVTDFVSFAKGYFFKTQGINANDARSICLGRGTAMEQPHTMLPVVAFNLRSGDGTMTTREIVVEPQEWKEMLGSREVSRSVQIPLILAYAITIHKSQGLSLAQVDIDFQKVFESGQSYVALSRCTDMGSVRLHGFDPHRVSANATALAYYKALDLHQERLRWRQRHAPEVAAAEAAAEALSCTPYGYVLPHEARAPAHYRGEDRMTQLRSCSGSSSSSTSSGDHSGPDGISDARPLCRRRRARHSGEGGAMQGRRKKRHRLGESGSWAGDHSAAHTGTYDADELDTPVSDGSDRDAGDMNEALRLDKLRRRITPFLTMAEMVKRLVTRQTMPLHVVRDARIVVDVQALFQLMTGPESAAAFDVLFGERDNMLRVPACVYAVFMEAAAYRSSSESLSQSASVHLPMGGPSGRHGDVFIGENAVKVGAAGARCRPVDAPLLLASDMAAEALAVMERAKQDFILDVQRPGQACALPASDPGWLRFAEVLPLLRCRPSLDALTHSAEAEAPSGAGVACREVDFILNRDPREALHHRAILEYAMHLQASFGEGVIICTDSVPLAAYAFAWRLRVASIEYLCSSSSGGGGVGAWCV
ncbi:hypothetical protein LSCM1_07369 [Leishmania martiniquensis]|uniref:ATP-dependent DNA helicase n=1 Tax=Leishmania martiniquensis TaxID=1580590 RepID=A0A836KTD5_9TRYP|nr:hypothetical protein LSCM1_07369 [Leishmania martiniquensis]